MWCPRGELDESPVDIRDLKGTWGFVPGPQVHGTNLLSVMLEFEIVAYVDMTGDDEIEVPFLNRLSGMRAYIRACPFFRDRLVPGRVASAGTAGEPADFGHQAPGQAASGVSDRSGSQDAPEKPVAPVGRIQQVPVFHPDPEASQMKQSCPVVHVDAQPVLPEWPEIKVVISLEIVYLHPSGHDSPQVIYDGRELPDKVLVSSDPEIEDVSHEKQVGCLEPRPDSLEKIEQNACLRLIEPFQVNVRQEVGFGGHVLGSLSPGSDGKRWLVAFIACPKSLWKWSGAGPYESIHFFLECKGVKG